MKIDCTKLNFGLECYVPSSMNEVNKLKSSKLVREIVNINNELEPRRNYMIISMNIFNILELSEKFEHLNLLGRKDKDCLYLVGRIYDIDCYLDLQMMEDTILLSWDKQRARELKLESLLNGSDTDMSRLKIDVIL